jgi:hypothetical protein
MGPLTAIFPRSKPVRLGDQEFRVWELRIAELAELQECLDDVFGCPLEGALERLDDAPDEDARREILADAYEAVERGSPTFWDDRGADWMATLQGLAVFLLICLRRSQPWVTADDCIALIPSVTAAQCERLRRVAFGVRPLRLLERLLGIEDEPEATSLTWAQLVAELCEQYHWTVDDVERLTLTQIAAFRGGGKATDGGRAIGDDEDAGRLAREQYRRFYGREMPDG